MGLQIIDLHYTDFNKRRHVRIDRQSKWGNPFVMKNQDDEEERIEVLWKYTLYLLKNPKLLSAIPTLEGKTLACWCYPKNKCHGQILGYMLDNPHVIEKCGINREDTADKIFEGLGWMHKKRYVQTTLT